MKAILVLISLSAALCWAQDDCKPSALNVPEAKYPCVYPDGRATFRVNAPNAQKVSGVVVTDQMPSAPFSISKPLPIRTVTFCAFGALTRNVARPSGYTHGYLASGTFSAEGLQSSCAQQSAALRLINTSMAFMISPWDQCRADFLISAGAAESPRPADGRRAACRCSRGASR